MTMVRKQIYLDPEVDKRLKREAKRRKMSEAALIRERLALDCSHTRVEGRSKMSREELVSRLEAAREEALRHGGTGTGRKFDRLDAYEERLERQMPR